MATTIDQWQNTPTGMKDFSFSGAALTTAVTLFLLRSHIRIHRQDNGKWELFMESKPGEGGPVADALKRIFDWLKDLDLFS